MTTETITEETSFNGKVIIEQLLQMNINNATYEWRIEQLNKLECMINENHNIFVEALYKDLGKCIVEAISMELLMILNEIKYIKSNLKQYMKIKHVPSPSVCAPAFSYIQHRPLHKPILIIGPSNYPFGLLLQPLVGALAGGNTAIIKPSELCPNVEQALKVYIPKYFNSNVVICVCGDATITTELLKYEYGKIFFTGSPKIGKIIASAAAQTLTPTILELGGKSPAYIDSLTCPNNIQQIANRILWSKLINCGQTCSAIDTLIIDESFGMKFIPYLLNGIKQQYGTNPKITSQIGRIVTQAHTERLIRLIKEIEQSDYKHTKIITGGSKLCNIKEKYIEPTIILNPPPNCNLLKEEIFGPILPIITVPNRTEAIYYMKNHMPATPLCLYIYTTSEKVLNEICNVIPAGSIMRNDAIVHLSSPYIPFGGVGQSGYGRYHGKYTYDCFTYEQPVMYRPCFVGADLNMIRYHPYVKWKEFLLTKVVLNVAPAIPVLHIKKISKIIVITSLTIFVIKSDNLPIKDILKQWTRPLLSSIANILESTAISIRNNIL